MLAALSSKHRNFKRLWFEHSPAIGRVAASYELNPHKREELVQEIALACWSSFDRCKQQDAIKGFFLRIAHNKSVDHVSNQVRQPKGDDEQLMTIKNDNCGLSDLEGNQQQKRLMKAMQRLPLDQKQVIGLLLEGLSYQQISDISGISSNNVGVIINRGKKRLQELIDEQA